MDYKPIPTLKKIRDANVASYFLFMGALAGFEPFLNVLWYLTEETYITMAAYEPQLEDEVKFDMGKIVKVIQKNLDGWWLIK